MVKPKYIYYILKNFGNKSRFLSGGMIMFWLALLGAFIAGGTVGFFTAAILAASGRDN